ncbi:unnamed protein product [Enterobius vermicularis]|uniref:H/ACA ribonucleoprotein complex subunit n=1 Tax=Enterobius vermicularis TaxID=51028 RepID=A0A0N4VJE9_ENTVE|nr:unnamed protein product [Enterobius vermicularis]
MSTGCGDEGEHAVLLCCWLLAANIECYLILGTAFPEGGSKAAYVLAKFEQKFTLLNPSDGTVYSRDDPLCPLISVGTVITEENIFGNIQSYDHPSQVNFNFEVSAYFKMLLTVWCYRRNCWL